MSGKELAEGLGIGLAPLIFMFSIGYVGFWLSYAGLKTKDKLAKIALFGMPFYLLVLIFGWTNLSSLMRFILVLCGFAGSIITSFIWVGGFRHFLSKTLFKHKILNEDGYHTLFEELYDKVDIPKLMVTVTLVNNIKLIGYLTTETSNLKLGQGKMDENGNIELYVSKIQENSKDPLKINFNPSPNRYRLTVIPQQSILYVDYLIEDKSNH